MYVYICIRISGFDSNRVVVGFEATLGQYLLGIQTEIEYGIEEVIIVGFIQLKLYCIVLYCTRKWHMWIWWVAFVCQTF